MNHSSLPSSSPSSLGTSSASFDTGPLSWVIGEIRDALERSAKALQDAAGRSLEAQPTLLLHAKTHLHQAHGALQMVDVEGVDRLTGAAEKALDRFKDGSLAVSAENAAVVAEAYQALVEYLEELLGGQVGQQPVRLFPYYRALQELLGAERVHPGEMLVLNEATLSPPALAGGESMPDLAACRARFEKALLPFLKSGSLDAAGELREALAPIARAQREARPYAFWLAMQTVADLAAQGLLGGDIYLKQLLGQINLQLRRLVQGHTSLPDTMLRDALFFVAQAGQSTADARVLRDAYGLEGQVPRDYLERRYGRIDREALREAKEALARTKEGWDRIATGGAPAQETDFDASLAKLAGASEKLGAPQLAQLLRELGEAARQAVTGGRSDQFSMEMAAAMLFVEHGLDQVRQLPEDFGQHAEAVGQRLLALAHGENPPEAPLWQGELAHELQQGQTVAVLAGEIRTGLRQVEKLIEEYHGNPAHAEAGKAALEQADPLLHQLQGALAILDQDQATRACAHVRECVRELAASGSADGMNEAARAQALENLAQNIGALGFFIDALAQNPETARRRFRFDAGARLFRELPFDALAQQDAPPVEDAPQPQAEAPASAPAPLAADQGDAAIEAELLEIFIGEAQEVLAVVADTLPALHAHPDNQETLTRLRRSFHTLKGSGRMVGLDRFAHAAAAIEKAMNQWLAESRAATPELLALLDRAHAELSAWVAELAAGRSPARTGEALAAATARVQEGGAFTIDEDEAAAAAPVIEAAPAPEPAPEPEAAAQPEAAAVEHVEAETAAHAAAGTDAIDADVDLSAFDASAEAALPPNVVAFPLAEENIKRIGGLEIPLPLYNIYLGETEELMAALARDFAEWREEPLRAVTAQALKASHTLGGTSATVGFHALREIAFALEEALQVAIPPLSEEQQQLLDETVERVRIMRQVFSLGELAPAQPELLARLHALRDELGRKKADSVFDGADEELAQRLDALFAATYDSILADPPLPAASLPPGLERQQADEPPAPGLRMGEPQPVDPAVAAVDDLFDTYFDDPFDAPSLEQAVAPEQVPEPAPAEAPAFEDLAALEPEAKPEAEPEARLEAEPEPDLVAPPHALAPEDFAAAEADADIALEPVLAAEPVFTDELDPDLLPVFMEEAADLLPQIGTDLRQWQQDPAANAVAHGLLRALHTVKGSARMAGAMRLGQHTHALETQIENMLHAGTTNPAAFDELLANYDQALLLFEQLQQPEAQPAAALPEALQAPAEAPQHDRRQQDVRAPLVRVRADILDRMVNQAGEVSITRSRLENQVGSLKSALADFSDNLGRLRRQLREVEMQAESQIASRLSIAGEREFDPLEFDRFTRLQELTRMMAESVNDVASFHEGLSRTVDTAVDELAAQSRLTRELQRDLMRVRMVPFASLSERLFRVARQTAKETDKRVNLDIRGGAVETDRSVLERMAAPFEHLLRNAIVHGIEARTRRLDAGKAETGELLVQVSQQGNEVQIRFSDDGAGLDLARIRAKGESIGLLDAGGQASDIEVADLIFEPGFSTADALTELAGRGVGMDVVRSEARALGGRVEVASEAGKGAAFTIHLPLTLAVNQVVLVASGPKTYALPANLVGQVLQVREAELSGAHAAGSIQVQGEMVPLRLLAELLNEPGGASAQRSAPVLVLGSGASRLALQVDEVLGNREVVVKNVGPQLARMPGIAGATVLGSGEIVLILNPLLLPAHGQPKHQLRQEMPAQPAHRATVMVVDDSLTVRRVTQRLLEREGYRVLLAKDGVEALEQIQAPDTRPDLMLVDIEMPRMDGFDLTRNVRGNDATHGIPIVMITSRTADKHRNYALGLGVDAYFGKPFQEDVLLAAIEGLLA
jgi:chemosensory pili system protein ChpA (sensor histidine kinase/response regulator)